MSEPSVPRRMRSLVITAPGECAIRTVDTPTPTPTQVLIRVDGCGVCGSNLPLWEGRSWFSYPAIPGSPGHEGWGRIAAIGDGVSGLAPGDRVASLSGRSFAEYDIAPAHMVARLPAALDGLPFPGEPLGCAMNIFRRSGISAGQTIAIVGIGFLGAVLTKLASNAGATVIAISRRQESLDLARKMGAAETISMRDHWEILARAKELTSRRLCDRVIEAVGKQWPLDLAAELTREGGRLVIAGYHQDGPRQVNMQLWNWRGFDVVNAHERDRAVAVRGMREAVEAVRSGLIDPALLITHRYPLERLGEALNATRDRPGSFVKAIVEP